MFFFLSDWWNNPLPCLQSVWVVIKGVQNLTNPIEKS